MAQFNIRDLPAKTAKQIEALTQQLGYTKTQLVIVAIDRLYQQESDTMDDKALLALAGYIYLECYPDVDDKRHYAEKVQEIYEWLCNGDPQPWTLKTYANEWREYDEQAE